MQWHDLLLWVHVLGACVLLGTGAGIAFFMVMANRTSDARIVAHVAGTVVVADTVFTASAAIAQPLTGYLLAREVGWDLNEPWLMASIGLYVFIGVFWLPVVWMQAKMRTLAKVAARQGTSLPPEYGRLYRMWFGFGFPAFAAILVIVWLMLTKPALW